MHCDAAPARIGRRCAWTPKTSTAARNGGVYARYGFVNRDGKPYLTAVERELFIPDVAPIASTRSSRQTLSLTTEGLSGLNLHLLVARVVSM